MRLRPLRTWLVLAALLCLPLISALSTVAVLAGDEAFCRSTCHEMEPWAEAQLHSSHAGVGCRDCHADDSLHGIAQALSGIRHVIVHATSGSGPGVHPRVDVPVARCRSCHSTAQTARTIELGSALFRHDEHAAAPTRPCIACHREAIHETSGELSSAPGSEEACRACHRGKQALGCAACHPLTAHPARGACASCHGRRDWVSDLLFTHRPALGAHHDRLTCERCHTRGVRRASLGCVRCHPTPDHGGLSDCRRCHTAARWTPSRFVHRPVWPHIQGKGPALRCASCHPRGYATSGCGCHPTGVSHSQVGVAHRWLVCTSCHGAGNQVTGCVRCHGDRHAGSPDCLRCHSVSSWRPVRFSHGEVGPHLPAGSPKLPCGACHPGGYGTSACSCHGE